MYCIGMLKKNHRVGAADLGGMGVGGVEKGAHEGRPYEEQCGEG